MLRLATTAIAAVLAMSSTPLLAQDAPAPDTSVEAPATTADPLAPATTAEPIVAPEAAPEVTATEAAPAAKAAKATTTRTVKTTTVRRTTAVSRPAARPAPAAEPATVTPATDLAVAEPVPATPVEAAPLAPAEPVAVEPAESRQAQSGVFMAIAAAGIALAALVAALVALSRRRRRRAELLEEEAYASDTPMTIEPEPAMTIEPAPVIAAAPATAMAIEPETTTPEIEPEAIAAAVEANHEPSPEIDGPVTEIPEGFDLSRFGPHVQAAYQGPTEDNPSLSLKTRLKRATALDQMAAREAEAELVAEAEADTPPAIGTTVTARPAVKPGSDFMLGGNGTKATVRRDSFAK
jgi:hypothetical protein